MPKKYLLLPGKVVSATDGQTHYVTAGALADLYGVPMHECVIYDEARHEQSGGRGLHPSVAKLRPLWPRTDGNYSLEE